MKSFILANRNYTLSDGYDDELNFDCQQDYLFDLSYLNSFSLIGENAETFLQGQLTADITKVNANQIQQAAYCTVKGRIIFLCDVLLFEDTYKLILPLDVSERGLKKLAKMGLFSRVSIEQDNQNVILGLSTSKQTNNNLLPELPQNNHQVINFEHGSIYKLFEHHYVLVLTLNFAKTVMNSFREKSCFRGSLAWHYLMLKNSFLEIYPSTQGQFLPHRLGLQKRNYLAFDKGCYVGQEIIARTEYLAKLKYDLFIYRINLKMPPIPGCDVTNLAGKKIGEVVDVCPFKDGEYLVAMSLLIDHSKQVVILNEQAELKVE
jgi:folate-binding protein YgfZ